MTDTAILLITEVAEAQNAKEITINDAFIRIEDATQRHLAVSLVGNAATVSAANFTSNYTFDCSGHTGAATLNVPLSQRAFAVYNAGSFTVSVGGVTGSRVVVPAGALVDINNDGTDCRAGTAIAGVTSLIGRTGVITLGNLVTDGVAPLAGPAFTGTPTVPTAAPGTNTTQAASTAYVVAQGYLTANQAITLTGDVTGGPSATSIATTCVKLQGRSVAATAPSDGDVLTWVAGSTHWAPVAPASPGTGTVTNVATGTGLTGGPITATGTIALAAIADHDLLANTSGGSAAPVPTTLTALIDNALGSTQGDILYRSGSAWTVLAPGSAGQVLQSGGAAANPSWATAGGSGTVTSVDVSGGSTGLTTSGGPITGAGTITLAGTLAVASGGAGSRAALMQLQWAGGATVANDTFYFAFNAPRNGTINSLDWFSGTGSFTVAVKIAGTNVTGLAAVNVNTATPTNTAATAANTFTAGQSITAVITAAATSPTDALLGLNITWTS
jgi:hypothetical protein